MIGMEWISRARTPGLVVPFCSLVATLLTASLLSYLHPNRKMSSKRMTANPIKAPRYRPGKAIAQEDFSSEDDNDVPGDDIPKSQFQPRTEPKQPATRTGITSDLGNVDLDERRNTVATKEAVGSSKDSDVRTIEEDGFVTEDESEQSPSEDGDEEESSEEESSDEDVPKRILVRPIFIRKDKRNKSAVAKHDQTDEDVLAEEEARRKLAADAIVEEQIRKDIVAKEAGKKHWDDEEGDEDEVDDTDDLDPDAEYAAWKLRELKRIKRDREAIEGREKELEEIERRRALTEGERRAEDTDFIAKQKEEKEGRGKMGFMQKYHHKGAFYQDDAKEMGLERDIMGRRFVDDVDRELLPQALQLRDMTKLGKKGATKYKDLKSEDTGSWGRFEDRPRNSGPRGLTGDQRFAPDRNWDRNGASGANSMPVGDQRKVVGGLDNPKTSQNGETSGTYRQDRDGHSGSRSPRDGEKRGDTSLKRSSSKALDQIESDKRRRMD